MDLTSLLQHENDRLDRCRLVQRRGGLYVRGTMPSRDDPAIKKQTTVSLQLKATPENIRPAADLARRLDSQLTSGEFQWESWTQELAGKPEGTLPTFPELIAGVEALYGRKYPELPRDCRTIWGKRYLPAIRVLEGRRGACSEAALCRIVREIESPSSRSSTASILRQAVVHLGIPFDRDRISEAGKGYTRRIVTPRDIPTDEVIESYIDQIELPHWRWMYGMLWLFGIRPHEIVGAELGQRNGKYVLLVQDQTKTGARESWAYPDCKVEAYGLQKPHPPRHGKYTVAQAARDYLRGPRRDGRGGYNPPLLPFPLYALRHAYAIRLLVNGWPAEVGAKLMGHSVKEHNETYQRWVNKQHMAAMHERFLGRL